MQSKSQYQIQAGIIAQKLKKLDVNHKFIYRYIEFFDSVEKDGVGMYDWSQGQYSLKYNRNKCDNKESFIKCMQSKYIQHGYQVLSNRYEYQKNQIKEIFQTALNSFEMCARNKNLLVCGFFREMFPNSQYSMNAPHITETQKYLDIEEREKTLKDCIYKRVEKDFSKGTATYVRNNVLDNDMDEESVRDNAEDDVSNTELISSENISNLEVRKEILKSIRNAINEWDSINNNTHTVSMSAQ